MRIIINHVGIGDMDSFKSMLKNMEGQKHNQCVYKFRDGSVYFVKRTKSGYSIFKKPEAAEEARPE